MKMKWNLVNGIFKNPKKRCPIFEKEWIYDGQLYSHHELRFDVVGRTPTAILYQILFTDKIH